MSVKTAEKITNWNKLDAISQEVEMLIEAGKWNETEFKRLLPLAKEAVGEHVAMLEPLYIAADPAWHWDKIAKDIDFGEKITHISWEEDD